MKIEIYQKEASRTMASLESLVLDSVHMVLGMNTEVSAELLKPLSNPDYDVVNVKEEIGDFMWYFVGYAALHNLPLTTIKKVITVKGTTAKKVIEDIISNVGELQDLDKKLLAYKKPYDKPKQYLHFYHINQLVLELCEILKFDIEAIMQTNIDKLKARYPNKFTAEAAINRNLEVERKILEQ